jgi:hypothetical protein
LEFTGDISPTGYVWSVANQRSEVGRQGSEGRGKKSEIRDQRSEKEHVDEIRDKPDPLAGLWLLLSDL